MVQDAGMFGKGKSFFWKRIAREPSNTAEILADTSTQLKLTTRLVE